MSDIMPASTGDTNPDRLVLASTQEYADAICEITVLARGENPDRLIALAGAALRYVAANGREKALNEALEAVRGESLAGDTDTLVAYRKGVSNAAAAVAKLLEGGAR